MTKKRNPIVFLGEGKERKVFMFKGGKFVYKMPIGRLGREANKYEHDTYRHYRKHCKKGDTPYAACRLLKSGVLVMEYIEPHYHSILARTPSSPGSDEELPQWATYIDCYQVGFDSKGQLVAYDYGG